MYLRLFGGGRRSKHNDCSVNIFLYCVLRCLGSVSCLQHKKEFKDEMKVKVSREVRFIYMQNKSTHSRSSVGMLKGELYSVGLEPSLYMN